MLAWVAFAVSIITLLKTMATKSELLGIFEEINAATNEIASDQAEIVSKLENAGVDQEIIDAARSVADRLKSVADGYTADSTEPDEDGTDEFDADRA